MERLIGILPEIKAINVLPAGTGHQCITQTGDPVVVSAYPSSGTYNLCRGSKAEQ